MFAAAQRTIIACFLKENERKIKIWKLGAEDVIDRNGDELYVSCYGELDYEEELARAGFVQSDFFPQKGKKK